MTFIGRKKELNKLKVFVEKHSASLIVLRGRRRIGKSRLIDEFCTPYKRFAFSGLPPTSKTTAQAQRDEFAQQLHHQGFPNIKANDWTDLFLLLAEKTKTDRVIVTLDEISWMGSKDPDFLGKLKNAWDMHFKKNPKLILILCGSASSWIEKNILNSTGFLGRISFTLTLGPLSLKDCAKFWYPEHRNISAMDIFKVLAITGGIPRYLEEINPQLSADENIKQLCFTEGALLVHEFDNIFEHVFMRDSTIYQKLVKILSKGSKTHQELCTALGNNSSGRVLEYLVELNLAGFIQRDYTWHLHTGLDSKLSVYRLCDNYLRFYTKYIEKSRTKIARNSFDYKSLAALPAWQTMMGLQFENLILSNRELIWKQLNLSPDDIVSENPYFQRNTSKQQGCQIDYLIQTRFNMLYICEIKFSKNLVGSKVILEMREKIDRLKCPKYFSYQTVLIHVNGVTQDLEAQDYFSKIIDFSSLLN